MSDLKQELKKLIVEECEKEIDPLKIGDDEVLFGSDSAVGLDSLDALQISMVLQERYNVQLTDSKQVRKIMQNINTMAQYIDEQK